MSTTAALQSLRSAGEVTNRIVAGIRADQWDAPTPCTDWNVRTLLNHLVAGNILTAAVLGGADLPPPEERARLSQVDRLGTDPPAAGSQSLDDLIAAFEQPGVLERIHPSPVGQVPGAALVHLRTTETLVHGWDLAQATGQPADFPEALAEQELAFTQANVGRARTGPRGPFGASQPVADDAPAIDRLAALLGRNVPNAAW
ncbi:TIGR03086 family metal-binding protein [Actinopolymorpha singaporensis]|uniref:TIGR03086 family protein n=1 Tax=Actinopolymorpha singaporensis TaxID=117157 RepID=A0A1H1L7V8_9ACTN|nr:TIGR03086 family metal-binding protein [Actinopolymorpha singaporensis]SDR70618.1 TIGR03086 family protein [Actinopolymorpha singaporensis]